jgi:conjugative transposon TraM protein
MTNSTSNKKTDWKKYAVFACMGLLFAGAMYMIFSPSSKTKEEKNKGMGLNTEVPAPARSEIVEDKRTAYEQELVRQMQQERMKTLDDFTALVNVDSQSGDDLPLLEDKPASTPKAAQSGRRTASSSAKTSVDAYRDMNRTLGSFYEQPKEDERVKQLTEEVETLKSQLESQPKGVTMDEQLALMEKSYEMAARYLPGGTVGTSATMGTGVSAGTQEESKPTTQNSVSGKTSVVPVTGVRVQVVSSLKQQISDAEFIATYSQERNIGFYSPETGGQSSVKNTIRACIHDDQTVSDGLETQRNVRIRLTEPMSAGGTVIPANTILTGQARIGERLDVCITSIEYMGRIYATDISVFDVDGQHGIAIPPSMEVNAAKEVAANAGASMGTSITIGQQSAGQQIAADLGRGVIQGTSQYVAKKMRVIKIHLKAGHQLLLLPQ